MEDKKRKKEEKRKREASLKIAEQKNKVPDLTNPTLVQSPATPSSASPSPGPPPSSSPSPATAAAGAPPQGGNNAKRPAVANGQPPSSAQAPQRYMPREVPPRFRCQQDHKVLLKRGQPPLSCMLLGGGNGGGAATPLSQGDSPNATAAGASDSTPGLQGSAAPSLPYSSSSSVAASSTSNYANSTWGAGSGSQPPSQGWEKVIVDGSDLEEWPSIAVGAGIGDGAGPGVEPGGAHNSSASWSDRHLQQQRAAGVGVGKAGNPGSPSPSSSSSCSPNECTQSGGVVWGSSSLAGVGGSAPATGAVPSKSKASLPTTPDSTLGVSGGIPVANFSPNANPSAWPALVQDATAGAGAVRATAAEGIPSSLPSSSLSANPTLGHPPPSVNPASHQNQLNQMEGGNRDHPHGEWVVPGLEPGAGPNKFGEDVDCGTTGGGDLPTSLSSSETSSLWRTQPFSSNSKTSASRTDSWEDGAGGGEVQGEGGNSWTYGSHDGKAGVSSVGGKGWVDGSGGSCKTTGVSQGVVGGGAGEDILVEDWGNSGGVAESGGSSNLVGGSAGSGSTNSSNSSSGGSNGNPPASASPVSTTMTRAWDNQKGIGEGGAGEAGDWGGQGKGGAGTSSSSGGGRSRAGSGPHNQHHHHGHHRSAPPPVNAEVSLQNLLSRTDLDPRVLSNTGWGQTHIRQNVAWDLEGGGRSGDTSAFSSSTMKTTNPAHSYSANTSSTTTDPSLTSPPPGAPPSANLNGAVLSGECWEGGGGSNNSLLTRGPLACGPNTRNPSGTQSASVASAGSVGALGNQSGGQGKNCGGWGGMGPSEGQGKGWSSEGQDWRERKGGGGGGGGGEWGEVGQQGTPAGGGSSGWVVGQEEKGTGGWKAMGREVGGWGEGKCGGSGSAGGDSETALWGNWDEGGPRRGWGGGGGDMGGKPHHGWGGKPHASQIPNSQAAALKGPPQQQSQPQQQQPLDPGAMQGGWGRPGGPPSQNQSSGWSSVPVTVTQMPSGPSEGLEPSGWEEPSPQSISRKMEIDDGTSAWGDPSRYNSKNVNLWDKNSGTALQAQGLAQQHQGQPTALQQHQGQPTAQQQHQGQPTAQQQHQGQPTAQQQHQGQPTAQQQHQGQPTALQQHQGQPPSRAMLQPAASGNPGQAPGKAPGIAPALWGTTSTPSGTSVDNGTATWGKADASTGWGDMEDTGKNSGWGNPSTNPVKSGSKSMQEGWGEGEGSIGASHHSSWEEEEDGGGVWNSAGSQGSGSSYNSGGWGQGHGGKKNSNKGALKGGGGDSWLNPMTRQFSNMGLLGEDPSGRPMELAPGPPQDKKQEGEKRGMSLSDYNGEMRKGGRGGGAVFRSPCSKEVGPGEPGPYYDKLTLPFTNQDGCLGEEGPCSPFTSSTGFKPSLLYNHTNPPRQTGGHSVFGSGGMAQSRGVHQPGVPSINPSPGVRAQVPHQFLSPQVPGSGLKQMPPPSSNVGGVGGVGGGVFPPQLSPQHIAMLSSIYPHMQQFHLSKVLGPLNLCSSTPQACQLLLQQQQQQQQQQLLQNQRKFPQSLRQQPDPQQLARVMAILQQQQRQQQQGVGTGGCSKLSPSHLGGGAPKQPLADPLPHPGMGSLADLHPKTHGGYSGFASGVNLSGLELGSMVGGPGGMKDSGGQQSRFKWMMEGHSPAPSPPETALHKNGPISAPVKLRGGSPYSQYELLGVGEGLGMPPQGPSDNWHRTPGSKMGTKTGTSSWPPEFQPGVPWKGIQSADPESDPYMTPGSVHGSSGASSLNDTEHQLLRDNPESNPSLNTLLPSPGAWPYSASDSPLSNAHNSAKYTEYKPSWPPDPIGHNKLWKSNRNSSQLPRPPPGLTNQKQPSHSPWVGGGPRLSRSWGGSGGSQETRYGSGSGWSEAGALRGSCWLVLSNLTPQIDGSTLRTICMQHGPLLTFHLGQGSALIRYSTRQEAAKAQSALHMCVLGNTTILAEFVSEEEVSRYFAHSQTGVGGGGGTVGAGPGPSGTGTAGANSGGSTPGSDRERERAAMGSTVAGTNNSGGGSVGNVGSSSSSWQSLDGTGSSPDTSSAQGPGLSIFAQWSSNGGGVGGGAGGVDPGRAGLWGGMTPGYSSSSLWGAPQIEDRHQMGSPAALLPGDLLGGGADSI